MDWSFLYLIPWNPEVARLRDFPLIIIAPGIMPFLKFHLCKRYTSPVLQSLMVLLKLKSGNSELTEFDYCLAFRRYSQPYMVPSCMIATTCDSQKVLVSTILSLNI